MQWKSNFERETYTIVIIIAEMRSPSENPTVVEFNPLQKSKCWENALQAIIINLPNGIFFA